MPFLTEELWHRLPQRAGARSIALELFPARREEWVDAGADGAMALIQEIVVAARNIRAEMKVDPKKKVLADFSSGDIAVRRLVEQNSILCCGLRILLAWGFRRSVLSRGSGRSFDRELRLADRLWRCRGKDAEIARLRKEIERLAKDIESKKARLADETFLSKAPAKIVEDLKATLASREVEHQKLVERLKQLE